MRCAAALSREQIAELALLGFKLTKKVRCERMREGGQGEPPDKSDPRTPKVSDNRANMGIVAPKVSDSRAYMGIIAGYWIYIAIFVSKCAPPGSGGIQGC